MVRIRLCRTGAKKQPHYRVVVADQRSPRDGRFLEIIGHYNPRTEPATVVIDEERALHWLGMGAQPSDPVRRMLDSKGITLKFRGEDVEEEAEDAVEPADVLEQVAEPAAEAEAVARVSMVEAEAEAPAEAE